MVSLPICTAPKQSVPIASETTPLASGVRRQFSRDAERSFIIWCLCRWLRHHSNQCIDTDQTSSQLYKTGVLITMCGTTVYQGVLAVGHGTESGTGREATVRVTGGMNVKAGRNEYPLSTATLAAQDVATRCKELVIPALHNRLQNTGGTKTRTPGPGAQSAFGALARAGADSTLY